MTALDTNGDVGPMPAGPMNERFLKWSDLSPFTQGYAAEAIRAAAKAEIARRARSVGTREGEIFARQIEAGAWDETNRSDIAALARFDRLAPETLARIIADCEDRNRPIMEAGGVSLIGAGEMFWNDRQRGFLGDRFPPLTVQLGDDGKVRFA